MFFAYAAVETDRTLLFIESEQLDDAAKQYLGKDVEIRPYEELFTYLKSLPKALGLDGSKDGVSPSPLLDPPFPDSPSAQDSRPIQSLPRHYRSNLPILLIPHHPVRTSLQDHPLPRRCSQGYQERNRARRFQAKPHPRRSRPGAVLLLARGSAERR